MKHTPAKTRFSKMIEKKGIKKKKTGGNIFFFRIALNKELENQAGQQDMSF